MVWAARDVVLDASSPRHHRILDTEHYRCLIPTTIPSLIPVPDRQYTEY